LVYSDQTAKESPVRNTRRKREPTPKSNEFAFSLAAYIQATTGTCSLCGQSEEERSTTKRKAIPIKVTRFSLLFNELL
jgi:hypothetical protein